MLVDARTTGYTQQNNTAVKTFKASDTQKVSSMLNLFTVVAVIAIALVMSGIIH